MDETFIVDFRFTRRNIDINGMFCELLQVPSSKLNPVSLSVRILGLLYNGSGHYVELLGYIADELGADEQIDIGMAAYLIDKIYTNIMEEVGRTIRFCSGREINDISVVRHLLADIYVIKVEYEKDISPIVTPNKGDER